MIFKRWFEYIVVFITTLFSFSFAYACHPKHDIPGSEIICPAEERHATQDLKEKGLGIADMQIIDEANCTVTDDETSKKIYGWCEHRKADNNSLVYIVVYGNKDRNIIRFVLIMNPKTKETIVFYDSERKIDI